MHIGNIGAGRTGHQQVIRQSKGAVAVVLRQQGRRIAPRKSDARNGSRVHQPACGLGRAVAPIGATRQKGPVAAKLRHRHGNPQGKFLIAPALALAAQGDRGFAAKDKTGGGGLGAGCRRDDFRGGLLDIADQPVVADLGGRAAGRCHRSKADAVRTDKVVPGRR